MKNLVTMIVLCAATGLWSADLQAQVTVLPSIGSVYNFSVGDSFLYKLTDISNNTPKVLMYINRVVLSRDDSHYPDSLIYSIQEIFLDSNGLNPAVWDTLRIAYHHCNDTIFPSNGFIICQGGPDSCAATSSVSAITDTLFPGITVYHADFDCYFWNSGWNNAAVGLGIVHAYNACGDFVLYQYDIAMVHYYKVATGIPLPPADKFFELSPNPSGNSITITLDEPFIGGRVLISDITGRNVAAFNLESANHTLQISNLFNGVYCVRVANGNRSATRKLVVSH